MKRGNTCYLYREKRGSAVMSDDDSKNNIVPLNNNPPSDWNRSNNGSGWKNYFDKQNIISGIISGNSFLYLFRLLQMRFVKSHHVVMDSALSSRLSGPRWLL